MNSFLNLINNRRSIYGISNQISVTEENLKDMITFAIKNTPSAFNSESSRIVLLIGKEHKKLWDITANLLKSKVTENNFSATQEKINGFSSGYGTILFFEDQEVISSLQQNYPIYTDSFPIWSQNSTGMLQYVVWTTLATEEIGASLQHYNGIIDNEVYANWDIPTNWKLTGQMPFGNIVVPASEKVSTPIEPRFKTFS